MLASVRLSIFCSSPSISASRLDCSCICSCFSLLIKGLSLKYFNKALSSVSAISARLMVMQHGYESVSTGLQDTWGYLRRILPRHGIHITRRIIDRKPTDLPVESVANANLLERVLRQTVFDRRSRAERLDEGDELGDVRTAV